MSRIASSPCMSGDEARDLTAGVYGTCRALQQQRVAQSSVRIDLGSFARRVREASKSMQHACNGARLNRLN